MTESQQTIRADVHKEDNNKHVKIIADEWTPDYEGLTDAVSKLIDLHQLEDRQVVGTATFDKDADHLHSSDVEIELNEHVEEYRW